MRVRSPLLAQSLLFSFPPGNEMFQFPGFAPVLSTGDTIARAGLPHSEIRGLMSICLLPRLIAACHVLRRLREPRHPSCALLSFPYNLPSNFVSSLFSRYSRACSAIALFLLLSDSNLLVLTFSINRISPINAALPSCQCPLQNT